MSYQTYSPALAEPLTIARRARDRTLARPEDTRLVCGLFWLFALLPAFVAVPFAGPLVVVALVPLQLLGAILFGAAVARSRWCGALTVAAMPVTGLAMAWGAAALF